MLTRGPNIVGHHESFPVRALPEAFMPCLMTQNAAAELDARRPFAVVIAFACVRVAYQSSWGGRGWANFSSYRLVCSCFRDGTQRTFLL